MFSYSKICSNSNSRMFDDVTKKQIIDITHVEDWKLCQNEFMHQNGIKDLKTFGYIRRFWKFFGSGCSMVQNLWQQCVDKTD